MNDASSVAHGSGLLGRIIGWSLRHRVIVLCAALLTALAGLISLRALNIDAFPDTTPVQVQINTAVPSMVPEEVERLVTFPVELSLGALPGLASLRSISQFGLSQVVVTFEDRIDIYFARQLINERLSTVEMPPGIPRPEMGPVSTGLGEVLHYLVSTEGTKTADLTSIRTTQDWIVKPQLRAVPGTAEVNSWGGLKKQYQVLIDPDRLLKHALSLAQVILALRTNNLNVGGGSVERAGDVLLVHGIARTVDVEQIGNIVVAAKGGAPIFLHDLGQVVVGHEIRRGAVTADGRGEVVLGLGFMRMGENSYAVTRRLRDELDSVCRDLPAGTNVKIVYDRTELVDQVVKTVRNNLLDGALLVILILFMFLGNLRAGLVAALTIPLAMLFAFCGMKQLGVAGTLLSLGAIDFGIVVDSSVVVIENIVRRLSHPSGTQQERLALIHDAAVEVRTPAVFGQLIIMIVYIPILTLQGIEGKMFRPMAITVILVLAGSLILSLAVTPVLASLVLPRRTDESEVWLVRLGRRMYGPALDFVVRHRFSVLAAAGVALLATAWQALHLGTEFVPRLSEGAIVIGIVRPPGTSLTESIRVNTYMETALKKAFPAEIAHLWSRQGAPEVATDSGSIETTDFFISLTPRNVWKKARTQDELTALMEQEILAFKGQLTWFTQPIEMRLNEMISGVRADVALKLFGDDIPTLVDKARELEAVLKALPGATDVSTEQLSGLPVLQVRINQSEIARYGIPAEAVLDVVESIGGKPVGEIFEDQRRFPMTVRLPPELRNRVESIAELVVTAPGGERIPLSQLAEIRTVRAPKLIGRESMKRRIVVQCNVRGRDIGGFVAEARQRVTSTVDLPPGYQVHWGGQFENMEQAQGRLAIVVPLALSLIVAVLYLTYRNLRDTAYVFASVPFACIGGVLALVARSMPLSVSAAVGFITLSGVSVLNSMVFVTRLHSSGNPPESIADAIRRAGDASLRTVLMTALIASVGFIPMALADGTGAEVQRPLATVVIGGVISSMLMTLFVLPALYATFARSASQLPTAGTG